MAKMGTKLPGYEMTGNPQGVPKMAVPTTRVDVTKIDTGDYADVKARQSRRCSPL